MDGVWLFVRLCTVAWHAARIAESVLCIGALRVLRCVCTRQCVELCVCVCAQDGACAQLCVHGWAFARACNWLASVGRCKVGLPGRQRARAAAARGRAAAGVSVASAAPPDIRGPFAKGTTSRMFTFICMPALGATVCLRTAAWKRPAARVVSQYIELV